MQKFIEILDEKNEITERVKRLRDHFFNTKASICVQRARLYTQSFRETEGLPVILRRALALKNILENIDIAIDKDELLAGNLASVFRGASVYPEYSVNWLERELGGDPYEFPARPGDTFEISGDVKNELLEEIIPYWKGKTHEDRVYLLLPEETYDVGVKVRTFDANWISTGGDGHIIPNFQMVLRSGLNDVINKAKDRLKTLNFENESDINKSNFLKASIIACCAVISFAQRYGCYAKKLADEEKDPGRKSELETIARYCSNVPANPAGSFHEALQSILLLDCAIQLESNGHGVSFGRFDQYLYPFFKKDIYDNRITAEGALELLNCFWIKINSFHKIKDWPSTQFFIGNLVFQNLTIGGQKAFGEDAVNELTYLCLASTKKLKMIQPSLCVRIYSGTPELFLNECIKVIKTGIGFPALFNDEAIIPSMLSIGYEYEDAADYAIVGCVEPSVQGVHGGRYGAAFISWAKALEVTLNGGKDETTGVILKENSKLEDMASFEELLDAFKQQLLYTLRHHVVMDNCIDKSFEEVVPDPLLSSVVDFCIERGLPIKQGGAKYDFTGGQSVGVTSAINSLAALRKIVFEDKLLTLAQVAHALKTNFEDMSTTPGGPAIRQILKNKYAAFGNDDRDTDCLAKELIDFWASHKMEHKNTRFGKGPIGGIFIPSTATVSANVSFGGNVGATPDGRKSGEPVSEGISAYRGTDVNGPTSLINSVTAIPNVKMPGGQLLNVKISPLSMDGANGIRNMAALIKTLFAKKGFHVQFNVVDRETLLKAQAEPDKYQDLIVRVAGYSAFFVTLDEQVQNDIILRTEHGL